MSDASKPEGFVPTSPPPPLTAITSPYPGSVGEPPIVAAPRDRGDDTAYRPVSTFAVAAFGIAALYTLVVVGGAIFSMIEKMPWLMPVWTLLFPATAIVLALVGWMQIQGSEGTRAGKPLAVWAMTLSIVVALGYWAYYAATYFVIRGQAEATFRQYFEKIKEGKLESAFLLTMAPKQRPREDASLRDSIENRFNADAGEGRPGFYSVFKDHLFTHVVRQAGDQARIQPLGVASWEFTGGGGGYVIRERYRVSSPEMSYEGIAILKSSEAAGKEQKGRQWYVALPEMQSDFAGLRPTPEGIKLLGLQRAAGTFLEAWRTRLGSMRESDHVDAYLATLDVAEREQALEKYRKSLPSAAAVMAAAGGGQAWNGVATACAAKVAAEENLPGYAAFNRGQLVRRDKDFWATSEDLPEKALEACRRVFHTTADVPWGIVQTDINQIAYWSLEGDLVRLRHGAQFRVRSLGPPIEGEIVVECPARFLGEEPTPDCWRIVDIKLTSVRIFAPMTLPGSSGQPMPAAMPGQPGQPGQPGFGGMKPNP